MRIIGIAGRSGAGKNTVAGLLAAVLCDQGFGVKLDSFAAPMKQRARELSAVQWLDKDSWREWLQELGADMRSHSPFYLINQLLVRNNMDAQLWEHFSDKWEPADFLIITDVRFPNEAEFCGRNGVVWLVDGNHRPLAGDAAGHESETCLTMLDDHIDYVLKNERRDLDRLAGHVRDWVKAGYHLKKSDNSHV